MQAIPQASTIVSPRSLEAAIRSDIEQLRSETATEEQQDEIVRLEAIAGRARDLDALGERILVAVMPASGAPDLRGTVEVKARSNVGDKRAEQSVAA
jgi:hypothetical protein